MKKKCTACGNTKSTIALGIDRRGKDNFHIYCKICRRVRDKNREHTLNRRFSNYKAQAKKCNRIFNIDIYEFKGITDKQCKYCGGHSDSDHDEQFCGIDRVDSNKGYAKNNIVPCCYTCNIMKASLTCDEFVNHIKKIACNLK